MGRRSKVSALPAGLRDELTARLVQNAFSDYAGIADWLEAKGFRISKSALQEFGSGIEEEFNEAMGNARRLNALARAAHEVGDDDGALLASASRILQEQLGSGWRVGVVLPIQYRIFSPVFASPPCG